MFSLDHDDDDFVPAGSSKLASLFGIDPTSSDGNQSLMYNAPKQPKKAKAESESQPNTANSASMAVIHAVAAFTYKYEAGKYANLGKNGVAILGNHASSAYKLLLYKGQNQHVAFATITNNFQFVVQPNNYATFYDDQRQNWSLNFDSEQGINDFAKQVCLAKVNSCSKPLESLVTQDLREGDGEKLNSGDSAEIRYSGWLLTNYKIGEVFDSNISSEKPLRVKIHHGKCIKGIEDALVGMKKLGKRFAVVPPSLGYANKDVNDEVLKISTLIFEIDVKKVKFSKESGDSTRSSTPSVIEATEDKKFESRSRTLSQSSVDESIRARGASLSEQLTQSPDRKKATIISRIVKMGQPMLPLHGAVAAAPSSESENEEEVPTVVDVPPTITSHIPDAVSKPVPRPRPQTVVSSAGSAQAQQQQAHSNFSPPSQPVSIYQPPVAFGATSQQPYAFAPGATQYNMYPPVQYAPQPVASPVMVGAGDSHMPLLLSETRNQSMEVRLQLGKLAEKLDQMMLKVEQSSSHNNMNHATMETATLSFNIQRIFKENEELRAEVTDKNSKLQTQNEKIYELLQTNQKFMEQSTNMLEQRNNSIQMNAAQSHAHLMSLEQDKLRLSTELSEATRKVNTLHSELQQSRENVLELSSRNENLKLETKKFHSENESFHLQLKALGETQKNLERSLQDKTRQCQQLELQLERIQTTAVGASNHTKESISQSTLDELKQQYEAQVDSLKTEIERLKNVSTKTSSSPNMIAEVKRIMNVVYKHLQAEFEADGNYSGAEVCQQLMHSIRNVTLQLMEKYTQPEEDRVDSGKTENPEVNRQTSAVSESFESSLDEKTEQTLSTLDTSTVEEPPSVTAENQGSPIEESATVTQTSDAQQNSASLSEPEVEMQQHETTESQTWKPQPPPPPTFTNDEDDDDDWLK